MKKAIGYSVLAFAVLLIMGATVDHLLNGSTPSSAGQVICSTSSTAAAFESPSACGIAPSSTSPGADGNILCGTSSTAAAFQAPATCFASGLQVSAAGSSTTTPAALGFSGGATASRIHWDTFTYGQFANGDRLQFANFHGISIYGARGTNAALAFETGSGSSDYSLEVHGEAGGLALKADGLVNVNGGLSVSGTTSSIAHEAVHAPTLTNGWVNFTSGFTTAGYWKDAFGVVHLEGLVKSGTVGTTFSTSAIFTLPLGYRPGAIYIFPAASNDAFGEIRVDTSGHVSAFPPSSSSWVDLDGITFRTN